MNNMILKLKQLAGYLPDVIIKLFHNDTHQTNCWDMPVVDNIYFILLASWLVITLLLSQILIGLSLFAIATSHK